MEPTDQRELLQALHEFPGPYQIKAIGASEDDFAARVVEAACWELDSPDALQSSIRHTPNGRHVAVTLNLTVQSADQVLAIYARLRDVTGLAYLF